jgi:hypothetical protein
VRNLKKKTKYLIASLLLLGFITYSSSVVLADDSVDYPPFVQNLADKLGVDETAVQDAFDEIRADHFAQQQQIYEDKLTKAVEAGVITDDQKQALLTKHEDMLMEQDLAMSNSDMQAWFQDQGINQEALFDYVGGTGGPQQVGQGPMGMM